MLEEKNGYVAALHQLMVEKVHLSKPAMTNTLTTNVTGLQDEGNAMKVHLRLYQYRSLHGYGRIHEASDFNNKMLIIDVEILRKRYTYRENSRWMLRRYSSRF